ncbi:MAG: ATP-binding protein, partial [Stagnimonas sp.]|nr:ATP-binding protein [Stagnimonas sp.]
ANAMFLVLIKASYDAVVSARDHRERSLRLSTELQQETEQLARLVRAYTSTGEARYLLYYYDILAIREGQKSPPAQANPTSYWDAVIAGRLRHAVPAEGPKRSVVELMKLQGFGASELAALEQVFVATAAMNKIEQTAFAATQGLFNPDTGEFVSDGSPRRDYANQLVHSAAYNHLKANQSRAVSALVETTDERTQAEVAAAGQALEHWILMSLVSMGVTIVLAMLALRVIQRKVLLPINQLGESADRLAIGDYATRTGNLDGFDELRALGRTVDAMAQAIEDDIGHRRAVQKELEVARRQAEDATHAKSMFLANMSHEIRTPMNAVIGLAKLLGDTPLNAVQSAYLDKLRGASQTLLALINDVLDLSKIEAGKLMIEQAPFKLANTFDQLWTLVGPQATAKGLTLKHQAETDIPEFLLGDALRLGQVLLNLVGNAVKFTERGSVTVQVDRLASASDEVHLRFAVRDTGIGIHPTRAAALFQPFEQADASTSRRYGGSGLGLAICRQLVSLMGGEMGMQSVPEAGSTFWFTARFGVAEASAWLPAAPAVVVDTTPLAGLRVLVAEDNDINLEILTELLRRVGVEVQAARDGGEAVQICSSGWPQLVLMDMQMPDIDGLAATLMLRQDARFAALPIIALTANAMREDRDRCLAAGMNDHLPKPIDLEDLYAMLAYWRPK